MPEKKKRVVTHSGKFHTDDVFAVAVLRCVLGAAEIVRTRDNALIRSGDIVVDVGGIYDPEKNRFDHHQREGAGKRDNGVPYASFGLVWKKWGEELCKDGEIARRIDAMLVQPIDAGDNGVDTYTSVIADVRPYTVGSIVDLFRPTHIEATTYDETFNHAVEWAQGILTRQIKVVGDALKGETVIETFYNNAEDKRLIVFDEKNALGREITSSVLIRHPEPLYAVLYRKDVDSWQVIALNVSEMTFQVRKPLPESWAGEKDADLQKITGVPDAVFCHNGRFMAVAQSKEGALQLAKLALSSN